MEASEPLRKLKYVDPAYCFIIFFIENILVLLYSIKKINL